MPALAPTPKQMVSGIGAVLTAHNVTFDLKTMSQSAAQAAIMACLPVVLPAMQNAGFDVNTLSDLQSCGQGFVPSCLKTSS